MSSQYQRIFNLHPAILNKRIYLIIKFIIQIQGAIAPIQMRHIFDYKKHFFMRKDFLIQECMEFFFIDGLIFLQKTYILHTQMMQNLFSNFKFLQIVEAQNKMFLGHKSLKKIFDGNITYVIFFCMFQRRQWQIRCCRLR